jgi:hypothetical protein
LWIFSCRVFRLVTLDPESVWLAGRITLDPESVRLAGWITFDPESVRLAGWITFDPKSVRFARWVAFDPQSVRLARRAGKGSSKACAEKSECKRKVLHLEKLAKVC